MRTYTQAECLAILEKIRWNGIPTCPYCGSSQSRKLKNESRYQCNECFTSYSVTVDTLFHKTHVELWKWFLAIHLVCSEDISGRQLAKRIQVNKNTACFMRSRIKQEMSANSVLLRSLQRRISSS